MVDRAVISGNPSKGSSLGVLDPLEEDILGRFWFLVIFSENKNILAMQFENFDLESKEALERKE